MAEWILTDRDLGLDGAYYDYPELIRCKDCENHEPEDYCHIKDGLWYDNDYCSSAKRKQKMADKKTWQECQIFETKGIIDEVQSCRCPVCSKYLTTPFSYYFDYHKYCPNCGTRLYREGEEDETD